MCSADDLSGGGVLETSKTCESLEVFEVFEAFQVCEVFEVFEASPSVRRPHRVG
jgi:hypothetical protein